MRFASAVLLVVVALCLAAESDAGSRDLAAGSYAVDTPAPEGRTICTFDIVVDKLVGDPGTLSVLLTAYGGEAQISQWGIGAGFQPGCDIFPDAPNLKTGIPLPINDVVSVFQVYLQVHAHPAGPIPNNCTESGHATGIIFAWASTNLSPASVSMGPIVCKAS